MLIIIMSTHELIKKIESEKYIRTYTGNEEI